MNEKVSKVMSSLESNNIKAVYVQTKAEVCEIVKDMLFDGAVITAGGSMSLKESGVWEYWETSDVDWSELLKRYADNEISRIDFSIRGEFSSVTVRGYFQRNKKW